MERISFSRRKSEIVQVNGLHDFPMLSPDIDDKFVVDKHPNVIIAVEFEILSLDVDKFRLDLHGESVIVETRNVVSAADGVVVRVFDGVGAIEPAEVVQQEQSAFRALVVFLPKPETVVREREFEVTAGDVRILLAVLFSNDFGEEPVVEVRGVLAVAGEVLCHHGYAVRAQLLFDHPRHRGALAAALSKVFVRSRTEHGHIAFVKACTSGTFLVVVESVFRTV